MRNFLLSVRQIFQFQFWPHRRYWHVILGQPLRKYDIISLYQDGGRGRWIFPVSHLLISLPSEGQTKFRRHIWIDGWDLTIYTSVFEKQTSAILEFYFRFWSRLLLVISTSFCIKLPNFIQIEAPTAEIWRHLHFSRRRPGPLNSSSCFVFVDVIVFRRSKSISKPNFVDISPLMAEI